MKYKYNIIIDLSSFFVWKRLQIHDMYWNLSKIQILIFSTKKQTSAHFENIL